MRKIILIVTCLIGLAINAQTSKELIGKWQLVKWIKNGHEEDINSYYKTDKVFQVFMEEHIFQSLIGDEVDKGMWKLSKDNSELTIMVDLMPFKFKIDYFDQEKRIISMIPIGTLALGTFEYKKVTE